jgi:hypothetical protein
MSQLSPLDIQQHLGGIDYPAGKREIIEGARANGVDSAVIRKLQEIPDRQYDGPSAIMNEVNGDF